MHRLIRPFAAKFVPGFLLACASLSWCAPSQAEPVTNRVLSGYQIATDRKCTLFKINFNFRIRYVSHFPVSSGSELRIMLRPIDRQQFILDGGTEREALRPPAGIKAIQYGAAIAESPTLTIIFDQPVNFDAAGGADFQSLVVSVSSAKNGRACKPVFPSNGWDASSSWGETVVARRQPARETVVTKRAPKPVVIPDVAETKVPEAKQATGPAQVTGPADAPASQAGKDAAGDSPDAVMSALIVAARTSLKQKNYQVAIIQLKKATQLPENMRSPEARELLGVAYQKDKQPAAAKAVYEDYLRRYPSGEGIEGVKQRLLAMETADAPRSGKLRVATNGPTGIAGTGSAQAAGDRTYWSVSGSLSTFYIRNDSYRVVRDPTVARDFNLTRDDQEIHRNTLMSSFDLFAIWGNRNTKTTFRFSGTEQHRFEYEDPDLAGVSALYLDTNFKDWHTTFRIGRQTRNSGGVLGRFDGAVITYQWNPLFGIAAVGGSPVDSRADLPFEDDRYFYGGSLNFGPYNGFDASVYAIEQRDRDYLDRRAIGTELRYNDLTKSAFVVVDYDVHFGELNAAIFTGSWTLPDKSTVRVGADYRKAPYLTTWNALGYANRDQLYLTLYDLVKAESQAKVKQMVRDMAATYSSQSVGYTRQLTDKIQLNLDFTHAHMSDTVFSPDTGDEFYYSAQLVGSSLITEGDLYTAAIRYSSMKETENYATDFSVRYPITEELRIQPRIAGGYTRGKSASWDEYTVLPSMLIDYFWQKDLNFEIEVGNRFTWRNQGTAQTEETEFLITAGFRWDFYADAQRCIVPSVFCTEASRNAQQ